MLRQSGYDLPMDEFHDNRMQTAGVAADGDSLLLVDEADQGVGHLSKLKCHEGQGVLHRAFSLLIFNGKGELLLQQRSATKRLWPAYWSNRDEILAWGWISPEALQAEMASRGAGNFTPWFKIEWARIWRDHRGQIPGFQSELGT